MRTKHPRHTKRYREIALTLARHGLGWLALQLNLGGLIPFHWGLLGHPKRSEPYTQAEHLRMALEDLGATFVKLGQILSTRPDLVPSEYVAQFSKLQDSVPPISYPQVAEVIQQELHAPPEQIFKSFNVQPLASASIGQVHAARLYDDTPVAVKVQRPGVDARVEEELEILTDLARYAARHTEWGSQYDIEGWMDEFAFALRNELDYTREGQNADRIRRNFNSDPRLHVPRIYWEYSTGRVLTMEEISGIKVSDFRALDRAGLDRRRIAENCAHISLTMAYDHGFFHADPHPGNIFVLPGEVIALLDYGMVGMIDDALKTALVRIFLAMGRGDAGRVADEFLLLGIARTPVRRQVFKRDVERLVQLFYNKPLQEIMAAKAFHEFIAIARRHRMQLPSDLIMLFKVIAMSEGLGARLNPEFKLMEFAGPYFKRFWMKGRSPSRQARRLAEGMRELAELGLELPAQGKRLLGQLERGEMTFIPRLEGLEENLKELRRAWNRVAMSILTAALIVGLGLLMLIYHPPGWKKFGGWFFGILFGVTSVFGIGLLWSIWRSRDR